MDLRKILAKYFPIFFLTCTIGQAQFINYTKKEGLSSNNIEQISEDDEGFIYISGYYGLNVFDGTSFKVYDQYNTEGFSSEIACTLPLKKGYVLIGTLDKGLFLMDKYNQKIIRLKLSSFPINDLIAVRQLFLDNENNVWIGLQDGRILTFSSSEITRNTSINNTPIKTTTVANTNFAIKSFVKSGKYILAGGNDSRIIRIKRSADNYIIDYPITLKEINQVSSMNIIGDSLYIGTNNGIFQLNNLDGLDQQSPLLIDTPWKLKGSIIRSISVHKNNIWIGTEGNGLFKYDRNGKEIDHFTYVENKRNTINSNYALNTLVDSNENLWVGTWFGGINLLDLNDKNFEFVYDSKSEINLFSNIVWAIAKTPKDEFYLGTHGNGLSKYSPGKKNFVSLLKSPELKSITSLYYDENLELLFIGTWEHGVKVFDPIKGKLILNEFDFKILDKERIYTITKGPDNNLWIGSFNKGLFTYYYKENRLEKFQFSDDETLNNTDIRCVLKDTNENKLWVGSTKNGLFSIQFTSGGKAQKTKHYPVFKNSGQKIIAENLFKDSLGNVWILCRNGIGKINSDNSPIKLPFLNGGITTGMIEDSQNKLWISTYNGIFIYEPTTQKLSSILTEHTFSDILFMPEKDLVLAASDNGLFISTTKRSKQSHSHPNITFSKLKILDQPIKPLDQYRNVQILHKNLNYCDSLVLPYFSQTFSIDLNAISFSRESKEQLRYRLNNFEVGWNFSNTLSATASYTNVPPGEYVFEVQTSDINGEWGSNSRTLTIIKEKPWWATLPAYFIYAGIIILVIYIVYREIRDRIKIKQELKIEKIKQERESEIYQQKMSFFTNISHDIRTPLTLIIGPLEEILINHPLEKIVESKLQRMLKNSRMLLSLVNQILDFRKAETDNLKLDLKQIDLNYFIQNIHYQFSELAENKEIDLDISSPEEKICVIADPQKLESIFFNLLSNAIKFTPKYGQIMILFTSDKNYITIIIKDTGIGIPENEMDNIFTRFYRSKNNKHLQGTGIGVALVKKYIELHQGTINVKSIENVGTEFIIQLPVLTEQDAYPIHISITERPLVSSNETMGTTSSTKKATVLVIDDSYDIREYLKEILQEDYNVLTADNGKLGLSITNKRLPHLVISDIMMEGMDGVEVCERIKTNLNTSHIPVILLTAKNSMDSKIEGFEKGSDAYLEKPFNSKLLLTMVKKLIEHRETLKKKFLLSTSFIEETTPSTVDEEFIEKVIKIIHNHISESEFSVQELADKLKMSQDQIYRKIKVLTGLSTIHFIRLVRLKEAARLLADKRYTVNEIVYMVGFNNPSYFTRSFKTEFGVPPSEYLQSQEVNHE
ncbi:hybrid sensor histidine kinase/response regulator transcription factor [Arenibacter certesii]|uniref:histidine kinase n=1 Tax=Arenibacter certesii TaxID=228955 RepID=A0A918J5Y6_9FLAO|nr:hybrid sensor histidine kinase/response regulator transcription factor [Arenibacter certesii]GGW50552.1 hybrid sensor histidine kinase/response regulator [Arenibacter certesii]